MTKAYDMSRFQRIIAVEQGRVNGTFKVSRSKDGSAHIRPDDVRVYVDEERSWGRVLFSQDLLAFVSASGDVDIPKHMIKESLRFDVEDARPAIVEALKAAAEIFPEVKENV